MVAKGIYLQLIYYSVRRCYWLLPLCLIVGCEALHQSYAFIESTQTSLPVTVTGNDVWVSSIPAGADVYVQSYEPEVLPSHTALPEAYKGKTPLQLTLPPGTYWIEVMLGAEVFASFFSPPYDDIQFEHDGARSEALILKPFDPGAKRLVLRYYRLEKLPEKGETIIALFHPRGASLDRVESLYPQDDQFQFTLEALPLVLQQGQALPEQETALIRLMRRGGKVLWARDNDYQMALEVKPSGIRGQVVESYVGVTRHTPLLPDGGGF